MRTPTLLLVLALAATLAPTAAATTGPYVGLVRQDQTNYHHYNNNPLNWDCIQIVTTYTVVLTYAPPTDVLTLGVGMMSVDGSNGRAVISFQAGVCAAFTIRVTGTSVANTAAYDVSVRGGSLGGDVIAWD